MRERAQHHQAVALPEKEKEAFGPEKTWTLFFNSFLFSQGDSGLQHEIFQWLHLRHPEWHIDEDQMNYLTTVGIERTKRYLSSEKKHASRPDEEITNAFFQEIAGLLEILGKDLPRDPEMITFLTKETIGKIASRIVKRDYYYLIDNNQPWENKQNPDGTPARSRTWSHVYRYGICEKAPTSEYAEMWREIMQYLREHIHSIVAYNTEADAEYLELREMLRRTIQVHQKNNPDERPTETGEISIKEIFSADS